MDFSKINPRSGPVLTVQVQVADKIFVRGQIICPDSNLDKLFIPGQIVEPQMQWKKVFTINDEMIGQV